EALPEFVAGGGLVLGSCNGFQILCEAGLLPGALMRNECLQYRCQSTYLLIENGETPFTRAMRPGQVLKMPISHGEGKYYADRETLGRLKDNSQVVFRYCTEDRRLVKEGNPNGSAASRPSPSWDCSPPSGPSIAPTSIRACSCVPCRRRPRTSCRGPARTRGSWTWAMTSRSPSRSRAITTRRSSSRSRALPPGS